MEVYKAAQRVAKNSLGSYSDVAIIVRGATSSEIASPSNQALHEIAEFTYNDADCAEVLKIIDKRLNDRGKLWRHVWKALLVVEFIVIKGSKAAVRYFTQNLYVVKTLREFQYIDEAGMDQGANIRQAARELVGLLSNEDRLNHERRHGLGSWDPSRAPSKPQAEPASRPRAKSTPPARVVKKVEEDRGQRDLEEALRLSREDEERRQREIELRGGGALFDDQREKDLLDFSAPSQVSYDPYAAQQQAQQLEFARQQQMQAEYNMQQQQAYAMQQQQEQMAYMQHMALAQQNRFAAEQQQQAFFAHQQQQQMAYQQQLFQQQQQHQMQQQQPYQPQPALAPQPTGAPFTAFGGLSTPAPPMPAPSPAMSTSTIPQRRATPSRHAELEAMLAAGSGVDSFGNVGNMRVPVGTQFASRTGH